MGCASGIKCLVALQTHNKKFIVAEENGQAMAKIEKHKNSEIFEVIFISLDQLQFKGYHKKYLAAGPGGTVNANQTTNHPMMTWTAVLAPTVDNGFAFRSIYYGKYLGAETNGYLHASPHICKTLKVTSKSYSYQGKYQLSDVVNGKPSWKWINKVIWYLPKENRWCIAPSMQEKYCYRFSYYGDIEPWNIPREKWSFRVSESSDFAVECSGNGRTGGQSN